MSHVEANPSRYAWFGAVRDEKNLVAVHPANKLMDATGKLTLL